MTSGWNMQEFDMYGIDKWNTMNVISVLQNLLSCSEALGQMKCLIMKGVLSGRRFAARTSTCINLDTGRAE